MATLLAYHQTIDDIEFDLFDANILQLMPDVIHHTLGQFSSNFLWARSELIKRPVRRAKYGPSTGRVVINSSRVPPTAVLTWHVLVHTDT